GAEWTPGATSGAGYPANVNVTVNTTFNLNGASTAFQMAGLLTVDGTLSLGAMTAPLRVASTGFGGGVLNGGTIQLSTVAGGDLELTGSASQFFSNASGFVSHAGKLRFIAGGNHTVTWGFSTYGAVENSSGSTLSPVDNLNVSGTLVNGGIFSSSSNALNLTGSGPVTVS